MQLVTKIVVGLLITAVIVNMLELVLVPTLSEGIVSVCIETLQKDKTQAFSRTSASLFRAKAVFSFVTLALLIPSICMIKFSVRKNNGESPKERRK